MSESTQESVAPQEAVRVPLPKNARIRQLCNGQYVGEIRCGDWPFYAWYGVDAKLTGFKWSPGHRFYKDCLCNSYEQALDALAAHGIGKEAT